MTKQSRTKVTSFPSKKFLLDTHIWIWLANGSPELSAEIIECINTAGNDGKIYISAISVWEVAMLVAKNRISIKMPIQEWVKQSLFQPGLKLIPLYPEIAIESTTLPGEFHGDPVDKIIIATARYEQSVIITRDQKILNYSKNGYIATKEA